MVFIPFFQDEVNLVEFTELITGYRLRRGIEKSYVDIYRYDNLSSVAGYAVSVSESINELIDDMKEKLTQCECKSACSKCLKHYRNQHIHGLLDRFAALDLLMWGTKGAKASPISNENQKDMILSLKHILENSGCNIIVDNDIIFAEKGNIRKQIVVYPAMWIEPKKDQTIFVSDAYIKYAKPYAVQKILDFIKYIN